MAKPWVVINAQGRIIERHEKEEQAIANNLSRIDLVLIEYRARKKRTTRTFP